MFTNELLNMVLDNCFGNIFVVDGRGKIVYVNENAARALEVTRETLLTMSIFDLVDNHMVNSAACINVLKTHRECMQAVRFSNGVTAAVSAKPLLDEKGKVKYVVAFSQNQMVIEHFMRSIQQENEIIRQALTHVMQDAEADTALVAESAAIKECLAMAEKAACLDSTIMLYGESGTGKEVVARFVHRNSRRKQAMFLPVNCSAIPQELMESEFFGYEKGAFTGANREGKLGLFELADGGTLFLDEIGELNLPMQSKLLRVLETGEIMRIGGTKIKKVNVRIVAATNRDLKAMSKDGSFREDLFYRLNVIPIVVPPLRDRREDTAVLAVYFLECLNRKYSSHKCFSEAAIEVFQSYLWPGNVRELRNVVERIYVIVPENIITEQHAKDVLGLNRGTPSGPPAVMPGIPAQYGGSLHEATKQFQRDYISGVLKDCGGNVEKAAKQMKMGRSGLYKKLDKLGLRTRIHWKDFADGPEEHFTDESQNGG